MSVLFRAQGLVVRYGGVVALSGVDLAADAGSVVGLVGANGAGKTTLLDCLSGHLRPASGRVWLGSRELTRSGPSGRARRGVIRTFQDAQLFPTLPVSDALLLAAGRGGGFSRSGGRRRWAAAEALAGRMALEELWDRPVGQLSTGERKRLDLACAVGLRPQVLLLDEPSAGLAAAEVPGLAARLEGAMSDSGAAVVMVEHDLPLVWRLADRVVVLDGGAVAAEGPPAALGGHPALAFGRRA